jgi:Fe-S cluster assembly protein SufD
MTAAVEFDIREQAALRFEQLGWPTPRLEEWKYTNLAAVQRTAWNRATSPLAPAAVGERVAPSTSLWASSGRVRGALAEYVFVNGIYSPDLSSPLDALAITAETKERHYARYADYENHPMTALNTANAQDCAMLQIDRILEGFVHLLFIGTDGYESNPRNLIVVGRGAQATIVETYTGTGRYFTNAVTELVAGDGAVVDHTKIENESRDAYHVGLVHVHQERSSGVTARSFAVGGALVRNETSAALTGEGASLALDGLFIVTGTQHVDNHTVIDHAKPHCDSIELYKGILDQSARGIFDGTIIVREGAQKTVSRQTNNNLLLSESAIVDSKPTLVIHNDDVKCNHGSTIGQIQEETMFYLRSRGIGEDEARSLLVYAFASELVDRIKAEPVREQVRRAMFAHMPDRLPERRGAAR